MSQVWKKTSVVCLLLMSFAALGGCAELSPDEKVEKLRALYTARINESGFYVSDVPVEPSEPMEEGEPTDPEATAEPPMEPATRQEILLDVIVQHDSNETLPGITVDLELSDAEGNIKKSWRLWVETEGLPKANQKQVTETLVDIGYEEGDRFNAEIRSPIPLEERGDYREFGG